MNPVTPRSKKEDIWAEKERLETEARSAQRQTTVLEKELLALKRELERARERGELAEKLKDELRAQSEKLALLTSLTRDLASLDVEAVLKTCVERIPYLVGARRASLYLYDPQKKLLMLKQHTHERTIDPLVDVLRAPASLMAQAVRSQTLLMIDDLADYRRDDGQTPERPNRDHYRTRSCMVCPLVAGGEVLGVMNLTDRFDDRPFDRNADLDLVRQACDLLAV